MPKLGVGVSVFCKASNIIPVLKRDTVKLWNIRAQRVPLQDHLEQFIRYTAEDQALKECSVQGHRPCSE